MPSAAAPTELDRLRLELDAQEAEMALLRRRAAAAEAITRATSDATWDWDLAREEITWNAAIEAGYGYPPGQVGRSISWWFQRVHPDDRDRIQAGLRDTLGGGAGEWTDEYRFQRADGSYAQVRDHGFVLRNEAGTAERMVGAMQDLSWRRSAEERLALKAESLRLATDAAEVGTWDLNPQTGALTWSDRTKAMFGLPPAASSNLADFDAGLHPDDRAAVQDAFAAALDPQRRATYDVEHRTVGRDDGVVRWVAAKGRGLFDGAGRCVRAVGTAIDITARKAAEHRRTSLLMLTERLRELAEPGSILLGAESVLGGALGAVRVAYAELDPDPDWLVVANDWVADLPSLAGRLRRDTFGAGVVAALLAGTVVRIADVASDPGLRAGEAGAYAAMGAASMLAVPLIEHGTAVAFLFVQGAAPRQWTDAEVAFTQDVAERGWVAMERARANVALRRSEAELRLIADAVPVLIAFVDQTLVYRFANRAVLDWMGLLPEQVVGRTVPEIVGEVGFAARKPYMERALAGEAMTIEADWPRLDGRPRAAELRYLPRRDAAGNVSGFHVFVMDITDRKDAERALRGTTETLAHEVESRTQALARTEDALRQSQKMEAVGQLTGGLAHDFNNLLTGIIGSLELLQARVRQGRVAELDRYIAAAQGAAQRAAGLTHRLLAFSRRQTLDPKPTNVSRLVMGMEELIRRTVGPAVDIEAVGPEHPWLILCDPNQLENALLNLAINARDAMPDGGRLVIEVQNTWLDARAAGLRDMAPGEYVMLSVTDTGTGMAPEVVERAFDPFFTTKPLGQGTGLGLSMIYGFARQSGGQVRIHSQPGHGTTVTILLPRHAEEEGANETEVAAAPPGAAPRAQAGETVLVVDDEDAVRMLVAEVLADLGYAALEAADGASGLAVLQSGVRVDLLVTDVGLPGGMNGRQLADAARVGRPELRVLFITGYAEAAVVGQGGLEPGMAVLTKPFAMDALATRIRQMITG